ncbi:type VI secretion system lipoprotein TssJ [Enterobacteriaceae bacterium H20N1]|uniref:Type VI secretion system lipoprotein TssJ n=1 Tax=Dryocola boscaweniae TaxID=2925397 RepID=A0A9X2W9K1_9ENTR|nr:type VI secretion system lipoprotein TssJ [Dryocola boscaweniae]MCT4703380.1 type VI secretion system lipoprotein TssJ [Dryocola boscaweniae]MCT4720548.1 type VI secretion system lipoprotein TssJ [Dryocola boscaweniae]
MFLRKGLKKYCSGMLAGIGAILLSVLISACSSHHPLQPEPGEIKLNLFAARDINPNKMGQPAPLNLFIYTVKEPDAFTNADFFDIVDGSRKNMQNAASKIYEAILQPGESRTLFISLSSDIKTLGFVGAYRNLNDARWIVTWNVPDKKQSWWQKFFSEDSLELNAYFQKTAITIKKMD